MKIAAARPHSGHPQFQLFIGNKSRAAAEGSVFERRNPFDGSIAAAFANGTAEDAEAAIHAARQAFDRGIWSKVPARQRHDVLRRAADLIRSRVEDFVSRMVLESGKPIILARGEAAAAARTFEYYAGLALSDEGSAIAGRVPHAMGLILPEPVGVCAFITPWNFPMLNPACKIAPALAAGCTVVIKPSHLCPGPVAVMAEVLAEAGLPEGVFNLVTSDIERGGVVGQALAGSPLVDKVAFTGSTATGRAVMRAAAGNNKHVALELGGKSANIVFADAPFEAAVATAISAFCFNSGQQCSAGSRLLVQKSIQDRFLEALVAAAGRQVLGDPLQNDTTMGPLVNDEQFDRVSGYVELGDSEGTRIHGGPTGSGLFVAPTIFAGVSNKARIAQEEIFGPVLSVIAFEDEAEAVALANDSDYGLAGGVWSRSIDTALRVAREVRTGKMFVNCYNSAGIDDMPHGGVKDSGIGREFGRQGLEEYQSVKTVQIRLDN
ncbi:aldehyde dehydrogenase (NAD+) [Aminobacter aminovorans]|uniref:Betaine aldehyde dehydrogenase n=1 Tax=Aminobacter aminovorans TaxID=83263 RepID=A0A381IJR2_AMIAI|nr:aldehyde dehydrogenase family protein [Aminobacter aminovorans]TCS25044.1 aldehyde dehydrogenase (NAD+) [Aminobacter aminovorans]SUY28486.1 Betaine aldehyde dehydrogenase [Aminobacter aminovorans]